MAFPSLFISLSGWRSRLLEPYVSGSCISRLTETCGTKFNKKGGNISPSYCYTSLHFSLFRKNLHCEFLSLCPLFPLPLRVKLVGGRSGRSKYGIPFFCFLIVRNGIYLVYIRPSSPSSFPWTGVSSPFHLLNQLGRVAFGSFIIIHDPSC